MLPYRFFGIFLMALSSVSSADGIAPQCTIDTSKSCDSYYQNAKNTWIAYDKHFDDLSPATIKDMISSMRTYGDWCIKACIQDSGACAESYFLECNRIINYFEDVNEPRE